MVTDKQKHGGRPPFAPPHGYMVKLEVFYTQTCVTIMNRGKKGGYKQHAQFWLHPDDLPDFLKCWYELGADTAVRRNWGRSAPDVSLDPTSNLLPEIVKGDPTTDGGGSDNPASTQLSFDLW